MRGSGGEPHGHVLNPEALFRPAPHARESWALGAGRLGLGGKTGTISLSKQRPREAASPRKSVAGSRAAALGTLRSARQQLGPLGPPAPHRAPGLRCACTQSLFTPGKRCSPSAWRRPRVCLLRPPARGSRSRGRQRECCPGIWLERGALGQFSCFPLLLTLGQWQAIRPWSRLQACSYPLCLPAPL